MKKNNGISLCRSVAMIMIIICHFGTAYGHASIGQFFQSGVQVFLLISGLLYGSKEIISCKKWLIGRWERVCVPCYLHLAVIVVLSLIKKIKLSLIGMIQILLGLEGYHHIITFLDNPWSVVGTSHLWFVTVIVICYFGVAFIKTNNLDQLLFRYKYYIIFVLTVISFVTGLVGVRIDYFIIFLIGYLFSFLKDEAVKKKHIVISTILFVFAVSLRLAGKKYCDVHGDNNLYLYVIIPFAYNAIAITVYTYIKGAYELLEKTIPALQRNLFERTLITIDGLSYYIYITHYMFIDGPISLTRISPYSGINIILICCGILISGFFLKWLTEHMLSFQVVKWR